MLGLMLFGFESNVDVGFDVALGFGAVYQFGFEFLVAAVDFNAGLN